MRVNLKPSRIPPFRALLCFAAILNFEFLEKQKKINDDSVLHSYFLSLFLLPVAGNVGADMILKNYSFSSFLNLDVLL